MSTASTVSLLLRLLVEPATNRKLVGRVEIVDTGEVVTVRDTDDLVALAQRLAQSEPDTDT